MDATPYCGALFLKPEHVREQPKRVRIVDVGEGTYGLVLTLEDSEKFSLNQTNTRILAKAYGSETDFWLNHVIELELGFYTDNKDGEQKETVLVRPVSRPPPTATTGNGQEEPKSLQQDLSDDLPF